MYYVVQTKFCTSLCTSLNGNIYGSKYRLSGDKSAGLVKLAKQIQPNLCEYFVGKHGQHKICGIRDASSSSCCRSSLIKSTNLSFAITSFIYEQLSQKQVYLMIGVQLRLYPRFKIEVDASRIGLLECWARCD